MRLLSYYKTVTSILCFFTPLVIGVIPGQAAEYSLQIQWTYTQPPGENALSFFLYMEDNIVCQTSHPTDRSMDCKVEAPDGTFNFYISAQTEKGESPLSLPFPLTLRETLKSYSLSYTANSNGGIAGNPSQTIRHGLDGTSVEAMPATNHHFVQWSDGSTINPRIDSNVTASLSLTATFSDLYRLDVSLAGNGAGTVTSTLAEFDNCTTDCSVDALQDSLVTLTPIANEGYKFTGWSGDQCTGIAPCTIRMNQHYSIEASFEKKFPWNLFMPVLM